LYLEIVIFISPEYGIVLGTCKKNKYLAVATYYLAVATYHLAVASYYLAAASYYLAMTS
jgi:hypothetical protein